MLKIYGRKIKQFYNSEITHERAKCRSDVFSLSSILTYVTEKLLNQEWNVFSIFLFNVLFSHVSIPMNFLLPTMIRKVQRFTLNSSIITWTHAVIYFSLCFQPLSFICEFSLFKTENVSHAWSWWLDLKCMMCVCDVYIFKCVYQNGTIAVTAATFFELFLIQSHFWFSFLGAFFLCKKFHYFSHVNFEISHSEKKVSRQKWKNFWMKNNPLPYGCCCCCSSFLCLKTDNIFFPSSRKEFLIQISVLIT